MKIYLIAGLIYLLGQWGKLEDSFVIVKEHRSCRDEMGWESSSLYARILE